MPKPVNCCVPGCLNNFRNAPGLQYHRIPRDAVLRKQYIHLLRNKTLKLESDNTRICSAHFEDGKKKNRQDLPSIFPWTKSKENRRPLIRKELQNTSRNPRQVRQSTASCSSTLATTTTNLSDVACDIFLEQESENLSLSQQEEITERQQVFVEKGTQTETFEFKDQGTQTYEQLESTMHELNLTIERLKSELEQLKSQLKEGTKFNIENYKDKPSHVAFYTGFHDYETLLLCYSIVEESSKNINYGSYIKVYDDSKMGRPRKLSSFEEFIIVAMKLRLGLFNLDLAHRFKVCESTVSLIFRTWMRFLRLELEPLISLPPREVLKQHLPPLFELHYPES